MGSPAPQSIESVEVLADRVVALVRCDPVRMRTRDLPGLADRALAALPGLAGHECENSGARPIGDEVADTELAHLLEHVAVELLRLGSPHRANRGETAWDFARDGRGVFRVTLRHPDDLACLAALKGAEALLAAWADGERGDVGGAVTAVRAARSR